MSKLKHKLKALYWNLFGLPYKIRVSFDPAFPKAQIYIELKDGKIFNYWDLKDPWRWAIYNLDFKGRLINAHCEHKS